jgi:hypothetical protein
VRGKGWFVAADAGSAPDGGTAGLQALRAAHQRLLADKSLQFDFTTIKPPPPPHTPQWLKAIAEFLAAVMKFIAPAFVYIFWAGVAALVLGLVYLIVRELTGVRFARRRRAAKARQAPLDWRPDAIKARALLEDADKLAAEGRYDEAAHLILYRSIDDIEGRRPRTVRPALTSRDIARLEAVPGPARTAFSFIASVVEASFFGGRPVGREDFGACRKAYEDFAFPEVWA